MTDSPEPQDPPIEAPEITPILPDSDIGVTETVLEMPDPAPETPAAAGGGSAHDEAAPNAELSELQLAYECLEIRTPIQEFQTYANARLETLVRLGEADRAEVTSQALELGMAALRQVMGAVSKEAL